MKLPKNEYRISITSGCNMKCVYCHNEGNKIISKLSKDDIELLIKNSYDLGLEQIRLTGGEPLVHNEIYDICQMLSEKYNLKVGINTNCIEIDKLLFMIKQRWIHRVVVGLDYFNAPISKQSPVGISSKQILNNILKIKKENCDVSISTVYNNDFENLENLVRWSISNGIRIKILEVVKDEIANNSSLEYIEMREKILHKFNLTPKVDELFNEVQGVLNNKNVVTFFHSHCRLRECELCKKMHLRVTSEGKLKQCILSSKNDISYKKGNIRENIIKALKQNVSYNV